VTRIPSPKDTILKRYILAVIGGMIQMFTLFYALVLMKFEMKYLAISPLVIGSAFGAGGITSGLSLTIVFASIALIPLIFLYLWLKRKTY
jgi:ABC-type phosphate/phosphonate transport system permease subunit